MLSKALIAFFLMVSVVASASAETPKILIEGEYLEGPALRESLLAEPVPKSGIEKELGFFLKVPFDYEDPSKGTTPLYVFSYSPIDPKKPTMVFINGGPGGHGRGTRALHQVMSQWNVIHFDQRGTGFSKPATEELLKDRSYMSSRKSAQDLDEIRMHLKLDQISVYAHSYGTVIGTIYASLYPKKTRALVLEGTVFTGRPNAWAASHRVKRLQRFFNHLSKEKQDRILELSNDPHNSPMWFHDLARQMMYSDDFEWQMTELLTTLLLEGSDTTSLREGDWMEGTLFDYFGNGVFAYAQIGCRELSLTDPNSSWNFVFEDRKLVVLPTPHTKKMCDQLGWTSENKQTYEAVDYPLNVPVTYVNGTTDGATVAPSAIRHYKQVAKAGAQLLLVPSKGHSALHSYLGNIEKAKDKPKVIEFFNKALRGKFLSKEEAAELPNWKFTKK